MSKDRNKIVNMNMWDPSEYLDLISFYCLPLMGPAHASGALLSQFCDHTGLNGITPNRNLLLAAIKNKMPSSFSERI